MAFTLHRRDRLKEHFIKYNKYTNSKMAARHRSPMFFDKTPAPTLEPKISFYKAQASVPKISICKAMVPAAQTKILFYKVSGPTPKPKDLF